MKQFRIKANVNPKVLYNFGFTYRGNWARGELYQKEIPELKGVGDGISINFDLGAEIHFIIPYMNIKYPDIEYYIQDLIKAGYVEEFEMVRESKYLTYRSITIPKRKTPILFVCNKSNEELGQIRFYPQWRRFVFYPKADTLFDSNCLEDIRLTINLIQQMWTNKEDLNNGKV